MSDNAFYMYDGVVKKMPCSVQDYVFDDMSYTNKADIACGINTAFNEIIWYYPSANATQIDRAVAYNYLENTWYTTSLARTTWLGAYVYELPIATEYNASLTANNSTILGLTAGASYVYEHETGNNQADGTAITAFLTSGSVEIADGDELMSVSRLVPDFDNLANTMTATLTLEQYPQSAANVTTTGSISSTTEKIDVRGRGRAVKIKYETNTVDDTAWRLGSTKLQLRPDGRR
jgi:rubredoxin